MFQRVEISPWIMCFRVTKLLHSSTGRQAYGLQICNVSWSSERNRWLDCNQKMNCLLPDQAFFHKLEPITDSCSDIGQATILVT